MKRMYVFLVTTLVFIGLKASPSNADVLWDTGAPHTVNLDNAPTYLGYISGNASAMQPQRWAAIPFILSGASTIRELDADWDITPGNEGATVQYIIWNRTGLTKPTDMASSGTLGAFGPGMHDDRVMPDTDPPNLFLHKYSGLNIPLAAGDYYLTIYATGGTPNPYLAWETGGHQPDPSLAQDFMWCSEMFPNPGFLMYNPGNIQPTLGQDPNDRWTPSFALFSTEQAPIPEPGTLALLGVGGIGLIGFAWRRWKRA